VQDISGYIGRGGYEGIQNDSAGNVWIVEDVGGPKGTVNSHARQPNSFLYRYMPNDPTDLTAGGVLEALQVTSLRTNTPIVFHSGQADADILSNDTKDLRTYGLTFKISWVTVHDTSVDGTAPFDANAAAKAAGATPFKRPENGMFRPDSNFKQFVFDETGDTDLSTEAGSQYGGFGSLFKLSQPSASANHGTLSLLFQGDATHAAFDNLAFADNKTLLAVEDAGDTLHGQRNAFDQMWAFDATADYGNPSTPAPVRLLAQGRDPSATLDSAFSGMTGFQNDGDNEITGIHISDGDPSVAGILGAKTPGPLVAGSPWRGFYTAQHGDNVTYELILHK
jgi:secreted PhoX family phosphatase